MPRVLALFFISITSLCLLACGFHLRGSQSGWPSALQQLALLYEPKQLDLKMVLKQQLNQLEVKISEDAPHKLVIHSHESLNQIASYDTQGRPQQYTLSSQVTFSLIEHVSSESKIEHGPVKLTKNQTYDFNSSQIGGYTQEQRLVEKDLQKHLVFGIIQQMTRWFSHFDESVARDRQ